MASANNHYYYEDSRDGFETAGVYLDVVEVTSYGARDLLSSTVSHADVAIIRRLPFITQLTALSTDQPYR